MFNLGSANRLAIQVAQHLEADRRAALAADEAREPVAHEWHGEEWERLAWHLCAEEHGEEACNELVWEGGPIPEPWGDRWMKYEGEAKRMIALVREHAPAPAAQAEQPAQGLKLPPHPEHYTVWTEAEKRAILQWGASLAFAPRVPLTDKQISALWPAPYISEYMTTFARAVERAHGIAAAPQPEGGA
jgi:hypothetical protein